MLVFILNDENISSRGGGLIQDIELCIAGSVLSRKNRAKIQFI